MFVTAAARSAVQAFLPFALVHAGMVILASVFSIASMFAILGAFSAVLPRETFRAWSPWLRGVLLLALIALLIGGFAGPQTLNELRRHPDSPLRFLPPVWFVGLYQTVQHRPTPLFTQVGSWALTALAVVFAIVAVTYALSYRRRFAGVLEGGPRPSDQRLLTAVLWIFDSFAPRAAGFGRAAHAFAVRAILRSETHRLAIAIAIGLGWMAESSLAAAYLLILGLRVAFELPAGVPANWIFRVVLDPLRNETAGIARRVMWSFLVPLVFLPCLAIAWWQSGALTAVVHTAFVVALSVSLMEVLLVGYRKMPLTCPMPGFRDNFLMLCLVQFVGFTIFTRAGAAAEQWMWSAPWRFALVPAAMWDAWWWNRRRLAEAREAGELEEGLTFENTVVRAVTRLDLSS
jgi:hypothetical protein